MYVCNSCGGDLVFNPKKQKLQCQYCRKQYEPGSVENLRLSKAGEIIQQDKNSEGYKAIAYKCSHCGAELITTNETISTFCSFCRTGTLIEREVIKKRKPDYIIPFKISKKECEQIYVNKIKNSLFAPKSMIETQEVEKIRGIYMPYWIYNFEKHGEDSTKGSKYSHRSGDYVYYDDYTLTTNVDAECSGIVHDATSNFADRLSEAISPYAVKEKKPFSPSYLSGYYADNEDVDEVIYEEDSHEIASKHISKELRKDKMYHKYNAHPKVNLDEHSVDLALFPVYFLATKNKAGKRLSYAVINGQTGKIATDIPIDIKKFAICSLLMIFPVFFIINYFFTFSMVKLVICSIIFNLISIFILSSQNKKIDNLEEDKGKNGNKEKINRRIDLDIKAEKRKNDAKIIALCISVFLIPYLLTAIINIISIWNLSFKNVKMFVGIITIISVAIYMIIETAKQKERDKSIDKLKFGLLATFLVFCFSPASDIYYYIVAMLSIGLTILSFNNIIEKYNIISSRKLPQLEKRGGDENA